VKDRHKIRKAGLSITSRPDAEKRKRFIAEAKVRALAYAQPSTKTTQLVAWE